MAYVDQQNNQSTDQVAGATPLSTGTNTAATQAQESSTPTTGSTGSTIQSQSVNEASGPQTSTTNKSASKASSGMFTNIQKYVDKNKPQAQKMAGAVTKDVGNQAEQIRQVAEQKQAQQQQALQANQNALTSQTQEAQNIVNSALQQATEYNIEDTANQESINRFKELSKGPVGISEVGALNLTPQQSKSQALSQLAQNANTEEGRRNLLDQTFQKQGDYTRGMSGLDQLITSGDQTARENLIQGTQAQAEQLASGLQDISSEAQTARNAQNLEMSQFGENVKAMAQNPLTGMEDQMTTEYENALTQRAALLDPESEEYQNIINTIQSNIDQRNQMLGSGYADLVESLIPQAYQRAQDVYGIGDGDAETTNLQNYVDALREYEDTGSIRVQTGTTKGTGSVYGGQGGKPIYSTLSGQAAIDYLNSGGGIRNTHYKNRSAIASLNALLNEKLGLDSDLYGTTGYGKDDLSMGEYGTRYSNALGGLRDYYTNQYANMNAQDVLNRSMSNLTGLGSMEDIAAGTDINQYEVAGQENVNKMNALRSLLGQSEIADEMYDGSYTSAEDIQNLLNRYNG